MSTPDIDRLISDGIIELTGTDAELVTNAFSKLESIVTHDLIDSIPNNIDGNAIRGSFERTSNGKRRGIYYAQSVDKYLNSDHVGIFREAFTDLQTIGLRWLNPIVHKYELPDFRDGTYFDTLTVARYEAVTNNDTALVGHTDYGLITIGYANQEGLEVYKDGHWIPIKSNTPYIHTAKWLQRALRRKGVTHISKAIHRVKNCYQDRFFMGFFLEPVANFMMDGKSYAEHLRDSFIRSYGSEHSVINLV